MQALPGEDSLTPMKQNKVANHSEQGKAIKLSTLWFQWCARGIIRLSRLCFVPCSFNNSRACPTPTPPSSQENRL